MPLSQTLEILQLHSRVVQTAQLTYSEQVRERTIVVEEYSFFRCQMWILLRIYRGHSSRTSPWIWFRMECDCSLTLRPRGWRCFFIPAPSNLIPDRSNLIPDPNNLIPDRSNLIPDRSNLISVPSIISFLILVISFPILVDALNMLHFAWYTFLFICIIICTLVVYVQLIEIYDVTKVKLKYWWVCCLLPKLSSLAQYYSMTFELTLNEITIQFFEFFCTSTKFKVKWYTQLAWVNAGGECGTRLVSVCV